MASSTTENVSFSLRHRTKPKEEDSQFPIFRNDFNDGKEVKHSPFKNVLEKGSYWLTRIVFLRSLAFIYFFSFLIALNQNKQLIGRNGLLPADIYLKKVLSHLNDDRIEALKYIPSAFLFLDLDFLDLYLDYFAYAGLVVSAVILITGAANMIAMVALWILYMSLVNIGQRWYSFGWESQLLETGFLAIFFCPVFTWQRLPLKTSTPLVVIWGYRWLIFRIMLGAGLIKIRGDKCWRDLTCMNYHYETQPVPNPIAYYLHQSPEAVHKFETLSNHFIELVVPWFLFLTRRFVISCGVLQIVFQVALIISGNLSFLNWLTILPSLCCFDDSSLSWLFTSATTRQIMKLQKVSKEQILSSGQYIRRVMNVSLALLIAYLSIPVVQNLLSSNQAMNTSFEPLRIVNTYGAFGSMTKKRTEVILQGTYSQTPNDPNAEWFEYEFNCKPGNISQQPCLISPYHYRLDWLMWFAAFQSPQQNDWLIHLIAKFLVNDESSLSLLAYNPFEGKEPPRFVRAEHYRYFYTKLGTKEALEGTWWKRRRVGSYLPPVPLQTLLGFITSQGWDIPLHKKMNSPIL